MSARLRGSLGPRGSRAFSLVSVQAAVQDAFKRPGELQLKLVESVRGPPEAPTLRWARDQDPKAGAGQEP